MNTETFWQAAIPVFIGFVLHKLIAMSRRNKASQNTPGKFNLVFWLHDNWVSIVFHATLIVAVILYLPDVVDYVAGFQHTPKQIADLLSGIPAKLSFFAGGYLSAMPMSWFEKKMRDVKKKLGLMPKVK